MGMSTKQESQPFRSSVYFNEEHAQRENSLSLSALAYQQNGELNKVTAIPTLWKTEKVRDDQIITPNNF